MQSFVRATVLHNVGGRAKYISNGEKQEEIVVQSEKVDWEPYAEYERVHAQAKQGVKIVEGREYVIDVPNSWYVTLTTDELQRRCQSIAEEAIGKSTDMQWALHWNKNRTNLHIHVVFSERTREDKGVWDRDIYHTADGKVARRAADRARDADGNVLPPVFRKGQSKGDFSSKDRRYVGKKNLIDTKERVEKHMTERYGVAFDVRAPLHQYHEGKGKDAAIIHEKNLCVIATNAHFERLFAEFPDAIEQFDDLKRAALAEIQKRNVVNFEIGKDNQVEITTCTLKQWQKKQQKEKKRSERPERRIWLISGIKDKLAAAKLKRAEKATEAARIIAEREAEEARRVAEAAAAKLAEEMAIQSVIGRCEARWQAAISSDLRGWQTARGVEALAQMREKGNAFPVVYKGNYGCGTQTFDDWKEAEAFLNDTERAYSEHCRTYGRGMSMREAQSRVIDKQVENAEHRRDQQRGRSDVPRKNSGRDDRG